MFENRRKKNEEKKGWISSSILIPVYTIHLSTVDMCTKFLSSRPHSFWERCDENIFNTLTLQRKKKKNKGTNKSSSLIPVYKIHPPIVQLCNKFQPSWSHRSWEKFDDKLERKKNKELKGRIKSSSLIPVYTMHLPTVHVRTKFEPSRPHSSWEKGDEKF